MALKASTSRASWEGWAATFATFDGFGEGLGEGVGPLPLMGGGGHPAQKPPPQAPASSAFPAFPPRVHTGEPIRQWPPTQMGGGSYPPTWWMPPPPPAQLLPHFPPGVLPLPQKTHPKQKIIFPSGGVTHPKQTQKSRNRFPLCGIRRFSRFSPNPHIGGEGEVGLPLHPPLLLGDGDLPVPCRPPHPAGLIPRLPPPPRRPLRQPLLPLQLHTGCHRLGGPCPCSFCCSSRCSGWLGFVLNEDMGQLHDGGMRKTKETKKKHAITTAITRAIT